MVKSIRFTLPSIALVLVLAVVVILGTLSMLGPSVGNIYSNVASNLRGDGAQTSSISPQGMQQGQQPSSGAIPQEGLIADGTIATDAEINSRAQERIILRTATLRIVVSDTQGTLSDIAGLAAEFGGWVVNSNINRVNTHSGEEAIRGTITVRVMAERLDEALELIKSNAISIESEAVSGQDVTQQYVDLTSRLNNMQAAETQLQSILEDARRTEDVLNVYGELVRVRGEIESLQGQIQYYSESAAFSSISVELVPEALEIPIQIAGWSPEGTARGAFLALLNVLRFLVDVGITLVVLVLPVALIFGVPGWLVYRRMRRRQVVSA
jgi:hypothetical protein